MENSINFESSYDNTTNGKYLFIRHGQTRYNQLRYETKEYSLQYNLSFADCQLDSTGISQAEGLASELSKIKIKSVYCSPLQRCLDTCHIALRNHPQAKQGIRIVVHPLAIEIFQSVHDLSIDLEEKKVKYNEIDGLKFDWDLFKGLDRYYNFEFFDEEYKEQAKDTLKGIGKLDDVIKSSLDKKEFLESYHNGYKRAQRFKAYLKQNHAEDKEDEKILVFIHSSYLSVLKLDKCPDREINSLEVTEVKNCGVISVYL